MLILFLSLLGDQVSKLSLSNTMSEDVRLMDIQDESKNRQLCFCGLRFTRRLLDTPPF
jgi:hypothetical protein